MLLLLLRIKDFFALTIDASGFFNKSFSAVGDSFVNTEQGSVPEVGKNGSPLTISWGFILADMAVRNGQMFAEKVACGLDDLKCFQRLPVQLLLNLTDYLDDPTDSISSGHAFNGVVDQTFTENPFLSDTPLNLLKNGDFNQDVEIILGGNQDEGLGDTINLYLHPELYQVLASDWDHYGPLILLDRTGLGDISEEDIETANKILEYYVGSVNNFNAENFQAITDMKTDSLFWFSIEETVSFLFV